MFFIIHTYRDEFLCRNFRCEDIHLRLHRFDPTRETCGKRQYSRLFLCLSRACLGKRSFFSIEMAQRRRCFRTAHDRPTLVRLRELKDRASKRCQKLTVCHHHLGDVANPYNTIKQENAATTLFWVLSLCLSRVSLGKMIVFIDKRTKSTVWVAVS